MIQHPIILACLLSLAVFICLACALGVAVVRDPFQRLNFAAPVTSMAIALIVAAIWVEDTDWQARVKSVLIALVLFWMNSILTHATARAIRIREVGHWPPTPDERIPHINAEGELQNDGGQAPPDSMSRSSADRPNNASGDDRPQHPPGEVQQ